MVSPLKRRILLFASLFFLMLFPSADSAVFTDMNPLANILSQKTCREWIDPSAVVHVRGDDELTALACWGYVLGRDRAWQIDFLRKIAQGRKSEVVGFSGLRSDVSMRLLDIERRASEIFEHLPTDSKSRFWAYSWGLNLGFQRAMKEGVLEFQKLGYQPDPWHPRDSIALMFLQAFDQTRKGLEQDLNEQTYKDQFGESASFLFSPDGNPWDTSILKRGEFHEAPGSLYAIQSEKPRQPDLSLTAESHKPKTPSIFEPLPVGAGSNNWTVSAERSKTGNAWFANDPHLGLFTPPFWYWVHVTGGALETIGAALPGAPIIPSGANLNMAWGLTNSYFQVADISAVRETELHDIHSSYPLIWIRWWKLQLPFFFKRIRRTQDGLPILPIPAPAGKVYIARWTGFLTEPSDFANFQQLMLSHDVREMSETIKKIRLPSWNFVFADTHGSIGYRVSGILPRLESTKSFGIPDRSLKDLATWPMLPPNEAPAIINPPRGYLATANNRQWPKESALHAGRVHAAGFRAFRIEELLGAQSKHDFNSMRSIQCDVQNPDARFFTPLLLRFLRENKTPSVAPEVKKLILDELVSWNQVASLDCRICAVYRLWLDILRDHTGLNEGALYRFLKSSRSGELVATIEKSLQETLFQLHIEPGRKLPLWGELHTARFPHLSRLPEFMGKEELPTPGDENSVNPGSHDWNHGRWSHNEGASQRMIVELTSPPTIHAILPGPNRAHGLPAFAESGSSSNPWKNWATCQYEKRVFPINWSEIEAVAFRLAPLADPHPSSQETD